MSEGSQVIQHELMKKRQRSDGLMLPGSPSLSSPGFTDWAGQGNSLQKLPFQCTESCENQLRHLSLPALYRALWFEWEPIHQQTKLFHS